KPRAFTVAPREMKVFDDAVATLFAAPESAGPIEFTGDLVFVDSRVYSPSKPLPTTGSYVPGLLPTDAAVEAVLTSLAHSTNPTRGFRTNVGVFNPGPNAQTVTVTLFDPQGRELGRVSRPLDGKHALQINDVFAAAEVTADVESAYAT